MGIFSKAGRLEAIQYQDQDRKTGIITGFRVLHRGDLYDKHILEAARGKEPTGELQGWGHRTAYVTVRDIYGDPVDVVID